MITFFKTPSQSVIAVQANTKLPSEGIQKLIWLFGEAEVLPTEHVDQFFIGPRREMITPWSTCAVEITQNMGIEGITRNEEYTPYNNDNATEFDPMLQRKYDKLDQSIFTIDKQPEEIILPMIIAI